MEKYMIKALSSIKLLDVVLFPSVLLSLELEMDPLTLWIS